MVLIGSSVQKILEKNLVEYVEVLYKKLGLAFFTAVQAKFSIALLFIVSTLTFSSLIPAQAQTACSPGLTTAPAGMGFHIDTTTAACSMITAPNVGALPDGIYVGPTSSGFRLSLRNIAGGISCNGNIFTHSFNSCGTFLSPGVGNGANFAARIGTASTFINVFSGASDNSTGQAAIVYNVPTAISVETGSPQSTELSTAFPTTMSAKVTNAAGAPLNQVRVTFRPPTSGASGSFPFNQQTVLATTNSSGIATAQIFTANATAGSYQVTADFGNNASANFALENAVAGAPELDVRNSADNADITDGSTTISSVLGTDFGTVLVGANQLITFRAENNGTGDLTFGSDALAISNTTDFTIVSDLTNNDTVSAGLAHSFTVRFNPASTGTKSATVTIRSDDGDEDPYTFQIQGVGNVAPTVAVDILDASLNDADNSSNVTFAFSEPVNGFTESDLTVAGGSISGFSFTNGNSSGSATFTANDNSTATGSVTIDANSYADLDGVNGSSDSDTVTVNTVNPTVTVNIVDTSLNDADNSSVVNFTLSEASTNFVAGDVTVAGGTLSGFSGSGTNYTATFTATDNSTTSGQVSVAANAFTGSTSGNGNASGSDTVTVNTVNPTVTVNIVDTSLNDADNSSVVNFTLSEASTNFVAGDVTVAGGTLSGFSGSGTNYTATFTATDNSTTSGQVSVAANAFTGSTSGNGNASGSDTVTVNTVNPTVTVNIVDTSLNDADNSSVVNFTLSEASTNFVAGDVTVAGGTLSGFSGSGTNYTATFTATDNSTTSGQVSVAANAFTGSTSGNGNASGSDTVTVNTVNPTVTVNIVDTSLNDADNSSVVNFTLSEASTNFVAGDVTVAGGTLSGFSGSGTNYTATFTATDNSTTSGQVSVAANAFTGSTSGNGNASGSDTVTVNTVNPTVTVNIVDTSLNDADNSSVVNFTLSEASTNFVAGDVTVAGGTLSGFSGSGTNYTATFTATDNSTTSGQVSVAANAFTGSTSGNGNASGSDTVTVNTVNPTVTVNIVDTSLNDADNSSVVNFTLSEASTNFVAGDVTVAGGTLSGFSGSGTNYTATFTATDNSTTSGQVSVAANAFTGSTSGNGNASGSDTVTVNTVNPTVTVNIVDTSLNDADNSSVVNFTLSEASTNFVAGDVTVAGGTLSGFSGSGTNYTATFTATDNSTTSGQVSVAANAFTGSTSGNGNASGSDTVTVNTVNPTVTVNIVDTSLNDADNSSVVNFTFSETVTGFTTADLTVAGGTISGFSGSGLSYSATFTATDNSTTTGSVMVNAGTYTNGIGNNGSAGSDTVTINTTNPMVTVDIVDGSLNDADNASNVTFTFIEIVNGFDAGDLTVVGGVISGFSGSGTNYTATFTANDNSTTTGSVTVDANSYTNAAGNPGTSGNDTVDVNTVNPTVTVNIVDASLSDADNNSNVTFIFSEATADFDATDVTATNGTVSGFSGSGTGYSATFTADDNFSGTGTVNVTAGSYTNSAANPGVGGNPGSGGNDTVAVDTVNPTVTVDIVDTSLNDADNSSNVTFSFSEATDDFSVADLSVVGGTISGFTGSGTSYSVTFTAADNSNSAGSVTVNANSYTDAAGNSGSTGGDTVTVDTANPTVTVNIVDTSLNDADNSSNVTFLFSESTPDFTVSDLTVAGGTISGFSGSGSSYSATFTAADNSTATGSVTVNASSYSDTAGNAGATGNDTVTVNTTNSTVTVNIVDASLNNGDNTSNVTFTFSEDTSDFTAADLTVVSGAISGFAGSGSNYSATFTANNNVTTTGSVTVDAGSYTNAAGNTGASGSDSVAVDTQSPTVTVDIVDTSLNDSDNASNVTFTFSETTVDFTVADITAVGGTISGFTGSGTSYSATFTAADNSVTTGSVTVIANSYSDAAGNTGASQRDTVAVDTTNSAVSVNIVDSSLNDADSVSDVTIEFSETVSGFTQADLTIVGGTVSSFTKVDGDSYTAVFTALDNSTTPGSVTIIAGSYVDAAGNAGIGGTDTVTIDTINSTVSVDIVAVSLNDSSNTSNVIFTFSEPTNDFAATDLTVVGGTITGFSGSGTNYTATFTAADNIASTGSVKVDAGSYTNPAGNVGAAGSDTVTVDTISPSTTITGVPSITNGTTAFAVTVTFSEPMTDFDDTGDITATNAAVGSISANSASTYTALITPNGGGDVVIGVPSNAAIDTGGNGNSAAQNQAATLDNTAPTAVIRNAPAGHDGATAFTVTVEFSEDVANFVQSDITVANGTVSSFASVNRATYSVQITPANTLDITIDVAAGVAQDNVNNNNTAAAQVTVSGDSTEPSVQILNAPAQHDQSTTFGILVEFSEDVSGFVAGDITVGNATVSNFVAIDGNSYTADITPSDGNDITIDIPAGVAQDPSANQNTAAVQITVKSNIVEQTQEQITNFMGSRTNHIIGNQPNIGGHISGTSFSGGGQLGFLGVSGNENSQTFAFATSRSRIMSSIQKVNEAALAGVAQRRVEQAFALAPRISGYGQTELTEEERKNIALHQGTSGGQTTRLNSRRIAAYSHQRVENANDTVMAYGEEESALNPSEMVQRAVAVEEVQAANAALSDAPASRAGTWDVWMEIYGSRTNAGTSSSTLWVGYVGAHYFIRENMLVGVLGQLDWADETNSAAGSSAQGQGWMIGPYLAGKVKDHNLYYEARAAWGQSDNEITPNGAFTDTFDTTRWMVSGRLSGSMTVQDFTVRPALSVVYWEETQEAYIDSLANTIAESTQTLGEVRFGPSFSKNFDLGNGAFIEPSFGVSGVFNFATGENNNAQGFALGDDDLRARLDAGINMRSEDGLVLLLTGFYDGIGLDNYESYGGSARVTVPLN